jgi:hypothetical protein
LQLKAVRVYARSRGGSLITWELEGQVSDTAVFRVWYSHTGLDDWVHVATVVGGNSVVDVERRHYGVSIRQVYRVDVEIDGDPVASLSQNVGTQHTPRNQKIAEEIVRKEYLLMRKRTGTPGMLLKRRHWGQACSCVDPDTGESRNSRCPKCYGTGVLKGYFNAVDYLVSFGPQKQRKLDISEPDVGTVDSVPPLQARAFICPQLDAGDIWVNCVTDERYLVGRLQETWFAGVPLLYEAVELKPLPSGDIAYELPLEGAPGGAAGALRLEDGSFLVYDVVYDGYYPVGILDSTLTVFNAPTVAYQLRDDVLRLYDIGAQRYKAVGLHNGVFEVYDDLPGLPNITSRVRDGQWVLWDRGRQAHYVAGLSGGVLTVFEQVQI